MLNVNACIMAFVYLYWGISRAYGRPTANGIPLLNVQKDSVVHAVSLGKMRNGRKKQISTTNGSTGRLDLWLSALN